MSRLEALWWGAQPGALALRAPLALGEVLFRAGAAARAAYYRSGLARPERAAAPVFSVGNLAVGGAGKTPAALALAARLLARGRRAAVLSRGYGASRRDARVVSDGRAILLGAEEAGDEPFLLARRLPGAPVLCGRGRGALARRAVEELGADALVLDDGFQHRALARDLDLVVVDAVSPAGNGRLLPRGPNREPWQALRRAHLAWISRADQAPPGELEALRARLREATGRPPVESRHAVVDVLDGRLATSLGRQALRGRRVLLLCALARPDGFRRTLESLGAQVAAERVWRDHHRFTAAEVEEALAAAEAGGADAVATTEKDAVRLPPGLAGDPRLAVVRIEAEIMAGEGVLDAMLDEVLARWPVTSTSTANPTSSPVPSRPTSAPTAEPSKPRDPAPGRGERDQASPAGRESGQGFTPTSSPVPASPSQARDPAPGRDCGQGSTSNPTSTSTSTSTSNPTSNPTSSPVPSRPTSASTAEPSKPRDPAPGRGERDQASPAGRDCGQGSTSTPTSTSNPTSNS